jgi:hypothetical protein
LPFTNVTASDIPVDESWVLVAVRCMGVEPCLQMTRVRERELGSGCDG